MPAYAGDVSPRQCWEALSRKVPTGVVIDVRSAAEWAADGIPQVADDMHPVVFQQWQQSPHMNIDPAFGASLETSLKEAGVGKDDNLFFMCRAGIRSRAAAIEMNSRGYKRAYNIAGGFDGHLNERGQSGLIDGWKADGLPWGQQ